MAHFMRQSTFSYYLSHEIMAFMAMTQEFLNLQILEKFLAISSRGTILTLYPISVF